LHLSLTFLDGCTNRKKKWIDSMRMSSEIILSRNLEIRVGVRSVSVKGLFVCRRGCALQPKIPLSYFCHSRRKVRVR
jgi:hypothetical protein